MSSSGFDVMQKKDAAVPVTWGEFEGLRDYLDEKITSQTTKIDEEVQAVQLQVRENTTTVNSMNTQLTALQTSIQTLTQTVEARCSRTACA